MANLKQRIISKKLKQEQSIKNGIVTIDANSCDGCSDCIETCPHDAISIIELSTTDIKSLSFKGRLKVLIKGKNKAVINQELCTACGSCMKVCYEFAIHKTEKSI